MTNRTQDEEQKGGRGWQMTLAALRGACAGIGRSAADWAVRLLLNR